MSDSKVLRTLHRQIVFYDAILQQLVLQRFYRGLTPLDRAHRRLERRTRVKRVLAGAAFRLLQPRTWRSALAGYARQAARSAQLRALSLTGQQCETRDPVVIARLQRAERRQRDSHRRWLVLAGLLEGRP